MDVGVRDVVATGDCFSSLLTSSFSRAPPILALQLPSRPPFHDLVVRSSQATWIDFGLSLSARGKNSASTPSRHSAFTPPG